MSHIDALEPRRLFAATFFVSLKGSDANTGADADHPWRTIQHAMNAATPGSTVDVLAGVYREKVQVNVSGDATNGFITFQAVGHAVIDGFRIPGSNIIAINNQNYIRIIGFEIRNDIGVTNGSGIRLTSGGDHIELRNNIIHNITGTSAMGITVYGSDPTTAITNLVIDSNQIFACQSSPSETLTLNGNVHDFAVNSNYIHNVRGIGIDFISGEAIDPDPTTDTVHDGVCIGNRVVAAHFLDARDAAGIWVDGSQNISIERNSVQFSDVGIELGAVNPTRVASNITVRDNYVALNLESGISIGGAVASSGTVQSCTVTNNTAIFNDLRHTGLGDIRVRFASSINIENNLILTHPGGLPMDVEAGASAITSDYNLFFSGLGTRFSRFKWFGSLMIGFNAFRAASGQDVHSIFASPLPLRFINGTLHILSTSPAVNAGDPSVIGADGEVDIDGHPRVLGGRVDIGADEVA
jgi:hypothetical protein